MGLIRNALRSLVDRELGVLGEQLDRLEARHQDNALQLASFGERFVRFANRQQMRNARASMKDPEFGELIAADRARSRGDDDINTIDRDHPWMRMM